jgi:L-alanine-DL-glutamate epimerase-like enolase superfamily enzyme
LAPQAKSQSPETSEYSLNFTFAATDTVHASADAPVESPPEPQSTRDYDPLGISDASLESDSHDVVLKPDEPVIGVPEDGVLALHEDAAVAPAIEPVLFPDECDAGAKTDAAATWPEEEVEFAATEWLSDAVESPVREGETTAVEAFGATATDAEANGPRRGVEEEVEFAMDWLAEPSAGSPTDEGVRGEAAPSHGASRMDRWSADEESIVGSEDIVSGRDGAVAFEEAAEPAPPPFLGVETSDSNAAGELNVPSADWRETPTLLTEGGAEHGAGDSTPPQEGVFAVQEIDVPGAPWGEKSDVDPASAIAEDEPMLLPFEQETPLLVPTMDADSSAHGEEPPIAVERLGDEPVLTPAPPAQDTPELEPLLLPIELDSAEGVEESTPLFLGEPAASSEGGESILTPSEFAPDLEDEPVLAPAADEGAPPILGPTPGPDETFPTSPLTAPWTPRRSIERPPGGLGAVRIAAVDVLRVRLPVAAGEPTESGSRVFVKLVSEQGFVGWGESAPSGDVESILSQCLEVAVHLRESVAPRLLGANAWTLPRLGEVLLTGAPSSASRSAVGAVDMAVCDLLARSAGVRLVDFLGGAEVEEFAAAHVEDGDDEEGVADRAARAAASGIRTVLLRPRGKDVDWIVHAARATVDAIPRSAAVVVDAGERFPLDEAIRLVDGLAEAGVRSVWDPLTAAPASTYAQLARRKRLPVALSRPLRSETKLLEFLSFSIGDQAVVDLGRLGGGRRALAVGAIAKTAGLGLVGSAGGQSALGLAHSLAVFARLGVRTFVDASASRRVSGPFGGGVAEAAGVLRLPYGVGCGVDVDESALRAFG